mgnify:CR=1 FL=1
MNDINNLIEKIVEFRNNRDWDKFHDSKNLALALSIEASELNELFLWKNTPDEISSISKDRLSEELADVIIYALLLAERNNLNITSIVEKKIIINSKNYPVEKSKGSAKKHSDL